MWRALEAIVKREGFVITRHAGPGVHPAFKASMEALSQLRLLQVELGLTLSARARVKVPVRSSPSPKVDAFLAKHGDDPEGPRA